MPRKRQRSRPVFYALIYSILGITLLLLLLPQMVSLGLRYGLSQSGAGTAEIGNVDINLFNGTVAFDELRLYRSAAQLLHLRHGEMEIEWRDLFKKRLHIRRLRLQGLSLTISQSPQGPLRIAGFPLPTNEKPTAPQQPSDWGFGIDRVELQDNSIQLIRTGMTLNLGIEKFELGTLKSWDAEKPSTINAVLSLNETRLNIGASTSPLAQKPSADIDLKLSPLNLALAQPILPGTLGQLQGQLSADLTLRIKSDKGSFSVEPKGRLLLTGLNLKRGQQQLFSKNLTWQGKGRFTLGPGGVTTALTSHLNINQLSLQLPGNKLAFTAKSLSWQGNSAMAIRSGLNVNAAGEVSVQDSAVARTGSEKPHTTLASLALQELKLNNTKALEIGRVQLSGLRTHLRWTASGLEPVIFHRSASGPTQETPDTGEATPFHLRIANLNLGGSNRIDFEDTTVNPPFRQSLSPQKITLGSLDTTTPSQPTPLNLQARLGEHSRLVVEGQVTPLAQPLALTLKANLKDYEMPPLTPYLVKVLGYKINSGQLDSKVTLNLNGDKLKGEAEIEARQLDMEPEDPERIAQFEQQSNMPINTALGLLRDKQNNIQLSIPFSGNLSDPKFDLSDAINTALAKTMKSAAVSYLKYLLQPYGSVITLVELAGKAGGGIRLEPIAFPAGSDEPGPDITAYIERLATLFKQRENLQLRLCGVATNADLAVISEGKLKAIPPGPNDQLEQLARSRAEAIKGILINDYGIQASKLFICNPELERKADAIPRVMLQL